MLGCPSNFFLRSSCIRVDLQSYESKPIDKLEQYDWRAEKNLDGYCCLATNQSVSQCMTLIISSITTREALVVQCDSEARSRTRPIFFCDIVILESIWYRTREKRLINESSMTRGLRKIWTGNRPKKSISISLSVHRIVCQRFIIIGYTYVYAYCSLTTSLINTKSVQAGKIETKVLFKMCPCAYTRKKDAEFLIKVNPPNFYHLFAHSTFTVRLQMVH